MIPRPSVVLTLGGNVNYLRNLPRNGSLAAGEWF